MLDVIWDITSDIKDIFFFKFWQFWSSIKSNFTSVDIAFTYTDVCLKPKGKARLQPSLHFIAPSNLFCHKLNQTGFN